MADKLWQYNDPVVDQDIAVSVVGDSRVEVSIRRGDKYLFQDMSNEVAREFIAVVLQACDWLDEAGKGK